MTTSNESLPKVRLFFILFGLGLLGVLSLSLQPLPLPEGMEVPFSEPILRLLALVQSAILLVVALLIGVNTAPRIGLHTPAVEALLTGQSIQTALTPQIVPGLLGGALAACISTLYGWYQLITMPELVEASLETSLLVRVLYGGITEELFVRWGVMSLFVWVGWRVIQRRQGAPRPGVVWSGNVIAALLFGLVHLPAASLVGLTGPLWIGLVVGTNALLGLLFGWLYWRKGLEAAMIAHASTHLITVLVLLPLLFAIR